MKKHEWGGDVRLDFVKHEYKQDIFGERKFNKKHKGTSGTLARDYLRQSPRNTNKKSQKLVLVYLVFVSVSKMRDKKARNLRKKQMPLHK